MKIKSLSVVSLALMSVVGFAETVPTLPNVPSIGEVVYQQDASRQVDIAYRLSGSDAVVTVDVLTNGVSIGRAALANVVGDVNRKVTADETVKHIMWKPRKTIPNLKFAEGEVTVQLKAWDAGEMPPYLVVDLRPGAAADNRVAFYVSEEELPGGIDADTYRNESIVLKLVRSSGESFVMGSPDTEKDRVAARERQHTVTFTRDFYLGIYQVSARQQELVTDGTSTLSPIPAKTSYNDLRGAAPAIDWPSTGHDVADGSILAAWRSRTGIAFDLPTSAQWEYACRAGSDTIYFWGTDASNATIATYGYTTDVATNIIGKHTPNAWGFYEMTSMPWSWCLDWTGSTEGLSAIDPVGPASAEASGSRRVGRGSASAAGARSAKVNPQNLSDKYGYRLVCPPTLVW